MPDLAHASPRRLREVAVVVAVVGYFVALHWLIVDERWPRATVALVVAPWFVALASLALKRLSITWSLPSLAGLALAGAFVVAKAGAYAAATVLVENVAFMALLAGLFAGSLVGPGEALITRLARIAHGGHIPPEVVLYTRRITAAWALFFVACAATSVALFVLAERETWSLFANLLYWPLVGAMFVVEYVVRRLALPHFDHVSLMTSVRAFNDAQKGSR